jgi:hypothetical protein
MRLAGEEGVKRKDQVVAAMREVLSPRARSDGSIWAGSSSWLITARSKPQ